MLHPQSYPTRGTGLFLLFLLVLLAARAQGRAVPYTTFEGRSPFEGRQMEAIERLRLRGASEKEIFARFPRPGTALGPVAAGKMPSQWSGLLKSVLAKLGVDGEQRGGVVESIEGRMAGGEGESGKRAVGEVGEEMGASGEMVEGAGEGLQARSHEMVGGVGGMMDGNESLDERDFGVTGEDGEMAAGDEHATHERGVDMVQMMYDTADAEHADSAAMEKRWTDDKNKHVRNEEHQTAANVPTDWKTSTEISVRADTAIERRGLDVDMENGGLEVRGQMGGLKAIHVGET
ncbi:hypothetical protein MMC15_005808 [Xylographa vitiligo]|nr:hypothetical protein [Xylographa vitiligo]